MGTSTDKLKLQILDAGLKLWPDVTARGIGRALGMVHTRILYHFDNADDLKHRVACHAVTKGNLRVIVQLIAQNHVAVDGLSGAERRKYLDGAR